jgi:hypothetical protein
VTEAPARASRVLAPFLADVDRDPEPGRPRLLDERQEVAVGVGPGAVGARAGDFDAPAPTRLDESP